LVDGTGQQKQKKSLSVGTMAQDRVLLSIKPSGLRMLQRMIDYTHTYHIPSSMEYYERTVNRSTLTSGV
jgi:hypothetical protein